MNKAATTNILDRDQLINAVMNDTTIPTENRTELVKALRDGTFFGSFAGSLAGAAAGKFLKLSKKSQVLMILAGFGVARAVQAHLEKSKKSATKFDKTRKTYEVQL